MLTIFCRSCGKPYPATGLPYLCEICKEIYILDRLPDFVPDAVDTTKPGLWRYWQTFGLASYPEQIYMGEGETPLIWDQVDGRRVGYKLESMNPTGSYKDRGTSVLIGHMLERNIQTVVEDSSGNAGASLAGYAARAGIHARIFVPESASGPKREQICRYGAELVPVSGPRAAAASRVRLEADAGVPYASHAYLPFGLAGIATIAYELHAQTGGEVGTIISPVGHGGLMLGIMLGFEALYSANLISTLPRMIGVQASNCNPAELIFQGRSGKDACKNIPTIAEGIRVSEPVRAAEIVKALDNFDGKIISVDEETILPGRNALAERGIYVEPTSAVCWSAYQKIKMEIADPVVFILTGSGSKYLNQ